MGTCEWYLVYRIYCGLIDAVRSNFGQQTEILIVYNDLPTNDFDSLIKQICGEFKFPNDYR